MSAKVEIVFYATVAQHRILTQLPIYKESSQRIGYLSANMSYVATSEDPVSPSSTNQCQADSKEAQ